MVSPVPSLIEITLALWWALMYSSACIISGGATLLAASSVSWVSAGVAEMTILAYGAIRWTAATSRGSSPSAQAWQDP